MIPTLFQFYPRSTNQGNGTWKVNLETFQFYPRSTWNELTKASFYLGLFQFYPRSTYLFLLFLLMLSLLFQFYPRSTQTISFSESLPDRESFNSIQDQQELRRRLQELYHNNTFNSIQDQLNCYLVGLCGAVKNLSILSKINDHKPSRET